MIAPTFFGYYKDIALEMKKQNSNVYFFDDRPSDKFFFKALARLNVKLVSKKVDKYIKKIIREVGENKIDMVFVILGQCFLRRHVLALKKHFKNSEFVYYSWDSVRNFPNILSFSDCFDRVYHFDSRDSKEYGYTLLPLYYSNESVDSSNTPYSFSAIFTVKKGKMKKYDLIMDLIPEEIKKQSYSCLYIQSPLVYYYYKLFLKEFRHKKKRDFTFKKIDRKSFYDVMNKSKVIIDCQMKYQSGLTMRTLEALHAGKKIITTNPNIVDYSFYSPTNICIVNKNNKFIPDSFFTTPFDNNYSISDQFSLSSFVKTILG